MAVDKGTAADSAIRLAKVTVRTPDGGTQLLRGLDLEVTPGHNLLIVGANGVGIAVGETVILLHPSLPLAGVSLGLERECQQNDSLADG